MGGTKERVIINKGVKASEYLAKKKPPIVEKREREKNKKKNRGWGVKKSQRFRHNNQRQKELGQEEKEFLLHSFIFLFIFIFIFVFIFLIGLLRICKWKQPTNHHNLRIPMRTRIRVNRRRLRVVQVQAVVIGCCRTGPKT